MKHRGPDWCGTKVSGCNAIAHERLAIIDPESGEQPLLSADGDLFLAANGEIYNHMALKAGILKGVTFLTGSDCEVIIPLYQKYGAAGLSEICNHLDGVFAFVLYDAKQDIYVAGRDPIGVNPLYIGWTKDGTVMMASELKAIHDQCTQFKEFPPGHQYSSTVGDFVRYYTPAWLDEQLVPTVPLDLVGLRKAFETAVIKRMMSDVPWGVLLSGGLDSSLVASIAKRHARYRTEAYVRSADGAPTVPQSPVKQTAHFPNLHSYCIGLEGSPDLAAAKQVAEFLGTVHHAYTFTVADGVDAITDVIKSFETFDVTTIRAGTPMFLMSRKIKASGIKMVISGEGADEALGGYLYFHKAPNKEEFHAETVRKVSKPVECIRLPSVVQTAVVRIR
jgi:asparagine synthase (glutamine-hydrolysing)